VFVFGLLFLAASPASAVCPPGTTNVFGNPDFETGALTPFTTSGTGIVVTTSPHGGIYSAQTTGNYYVQQYASPAPPVAELVSASFWTWHDPGDSGIQSIEWGYTDGTTGSTFKGSADLAGWVKIDLLPLLNNGKSLSYVRAWGYSGGLSLPDIVRYDDYEICWDNCADADGDGHSAAACGGDDCNDAISTIYPGAPELCDGLDNDCDGLIDDGAGCCDDADGDGYDAAGCGGSDCDDGDRSVYPGAPEVCDGVDNDCNGVADEGLPFSGWYHDNDGDGYGDPTDRTFACDAPPGFVADDNDCNDLRADVNPAAVEVCDLVDNDCDALVDEDDPSLAPGETADWHPDVDGDGYGDSGVATTACFPVPGWIDDDRDCDDADPAVNPAASEVCDGVDNECDGLVDDEDPSVDPGTYSVWYADADLDGYGDPAASTWSCAPGRGFVADDTDCDDTDPDVHPADPSDRDLLERCNGYDDDCDGLIDDEDPTLDPLTASTWHHDGDGDGFGDPTDAVATCLPTADHVADATDCDDAAPAVHPGASEVCNGYDDDCDALVDDFDPSRDPTTGTEWHPDGDSDGFGNPGASRSACSPLSGEVADGADCNDTNPAVNPAATEVCNGWDDECDGLVDDADPSVDPTGFDAWHPDVDGDGFGDDGASVGACSPPAGHLADGGDCDDGAAAINPAATEVCNGLDDDCDGAVDDADPSVDASTGGTFYADLDADGFGNPASGAVSCTGGAGRVVDATDCDDANAAVNPAAAEVCNGLDDDCDALVDDADPSIDPASQRTWWADADADGFGDPLAAGLGCAGGAGFAANDDDCNDADLNTYPGASELCDGADNNCNGGVDEGIAYVSWYADADADGYGDAAVTVTDCANPSGYVRDRADCDDADAAEHPGAAEVCDGDDDDCDGLVDEDGGTPWFADVDADGFGDPAVWVLSCGGLTGFVVDDTDCDDALGFVFPGADEWCDGLDDDCDGFIDEADAVDAVTWFIDGDGDGYGWPDVTTIACDLPDGYAPTDDDCDDSDATISPEASEVPYDGLDQDCDGFDLVDVDGDAFAGWVVGGPDCDDSDATVYPGAPEGLDGSDEDCDGVVDEGTDGADDDLDGFTELGGDCDDADEGAHPGGAEDCDGVDDDCDGTIDEGTECFDDDGDGFTELDGDCNDGDPVMNPGATEVVGNGLDDDCDGIVDDEVDDPDGDGVAASGGDCDDGDATVYPGAPELADGLDNDCDGTVDEGTAAYDDDGDGASEDDGDCDDSDDAVGPGEPEVAGNGVDDDCDGDIDEGSAATDDDGDGTSEDGGDCDDGDAEVYPGAPEVQNGRDDDCDGFADEDLADLDGDGLSTDDGDCDDDDGFVRPGAVEMCDGADNDCDGDVDEGCASTDEVVLDTADTGVPGKGCACGTGGSAPAGWLVLGVLVVAGRRRRG
jgi:MYXO-CTERM domain-containing protein